MLVRRLVARGAAVRVITRDAARASHLPSNVEIVIGDLRDGASLRAAMRGVQTVVAAAHGFGDSNDGSPESVDRQGNINLIDAATREGAAVVLMSVVGAAREHPMELFRAKYAAEEHLRQRSGTWTIVRATAFVETWATIMGEPLRATGRALVFGPGTNPINFVSADDVAALLELAVVIPALRGETLSIGGENLTFAQLADLLGRTLGRPSNARHIPLPVLRAMGVLLRPIKPALARHARAAVVMNRHDLSFDDAPLRRRFPELTTTALATAVGRCLQPARSGS